MLLKINCIESLYTYKKHAFKLLLYLTANQNVHAISCSGVARKINIFNTTVIIIDSGE